VYGRIYFKRIHVDNLVKKRYEKGFKNPRILHITVANNEKQRAEYRDRMQNISDKKDSSTKYINCLVKNSQQ